MSSATRPDPGLAGAARPFGSPTIVAEIGVNHNGDPELARKMVDAAAACGADVVKFQIFLTEKLVGREVGLVAYQERNLAAALDPDPGSRRGRSLSQFEMIKALELAHSDVAGLFRHCAAKGVRFLSSVGEADSVDFLIGLGVDTIKVASGDLTNLKLLRHIAGTGSAVWLSTGMATLGEVERAVLTLEKAGCEKITLFHCTTNYPTPYEEVNLRAIDTLRMAFGYPVGYSDHTLGLEVALGATALGAVAIEKHFTLDHNLPGPDHRASMTPGDFAAMVSAVRNLTRALGRGRKEPAASELAIRERVRKSLVAAVSISKGTVVKPEMLATLRTGRGLAPTMEELLIGARTRRAIEPGEVLTLDMFEFGVTPEPR